MNAPGPRPDAGFTLVEVVVALALLALISLAALTVLTSLAQTQTRTADVADRLTRLQRAVFLLSRDLDQAQAMACDGAVLTIQRPGPSDTRLTLSYRLSGQTLTRQLGAAGAAPQPVLTKAQSLAWRFLAADNGWRPRWAQGDGQPRAVELTVVTLEGPHDRPVVLRRLFAPPAAP